MARMVKKTIELDQDYVGMARMIFGVKTDKEAVNKALELAVIDSDIIRANKIHSRKGRPDR
jgi:Arc/MetJ family transcription regulator